MDRCPVCGAAARAPFLELEAVPVFCNVLWPSRETATAAPRGDVRLVFCDSCGMIWNSAFEPRLVEYAPAYENSLYFSEVFRGYAAGLAERLVERYGLRGKDVVDVGCGTGEFLRLVCELGGNRGTGFDPSYEGPDEVAAGEGRVRFVREPYGEAHAGMPADLATCRHVLEHVPDPRRLLASMRAAVAGRRGAVYVEVPAAEHVLGNLAGWDVIYEHCSLFSAPALRRLFEDAGFEVADLGFAYGGQYLWLEAVPAAAPRPGGADVEALGELAAGFEERFGKLVASSRARLEELARRGPVAVWGAGSKGVTFLTLAAPEANGSVLVVDVSPRKQGKHVPGRGERILAPEELPAAAPATVLVMNPLYLDEVAGAVAELGLAAEVVPA